MKVTAITLEVNGHACKVKLPFAVEVDTTGELPPDVWRNLMTLLWTVAREVDREMQRRVLSPDVEAKE